jgi:hypothetical protein
MSHAHRIIFSLLCVVSTAMPNKGTINLDSLKSENPEKILGNENLKKPSQKKEIPEILNEDEIAKMDLVFKNSPEEAQQIVNNLENPTCLQHKKNNFVIFFGDSQSDSKAMTEAIAYKMYKQGWNCRFFNGKSLFGKNSDHTAIKVQSELKKIAASNKPTIVVFYDLHQLLGYTANIYKDANAPVSTSFDELYNHHNPGLTNTVFWNFLNKQEDNEKYFFIGTMDDIQKLPENTKRIIIENIIEFPSNS